MTLILPQRGRIGQAAGGGGPASDSLYDILDFLSLTTNLIGCYDAGDSSSYSGSGTTWSDLSSAGNDQTLNGQTFNGSSGGLSESEYFTFTNGTTFPSAAVLSSFDPGVMSFLLITYSDSVQAGQYSHWGIGVDENVNQTVEMFPASQSTSPVALSVKTSTGSRAQTITTGTTTVSDGINILGFTVDTTTTDTPRLSIAQTQEDTGGSHARSPGSNSYEFGLMPYGNATGVTDVVATSRVYAFAGWNGTALSDTNFDDIYTYLTASRFTSAN